ncbi:unnamed protein product [Soboliphyme baturini]|uniref:Uncharacterized protein n=1 Tax=Soboliphyme baturini TaxID=241478 RepID=A0A183IEQ4_9BILA|nr:unnamed protein product [Soboliphyme baturini]
MPTRTAAHPFDRPATQTRCRKAIGSADLPPSTPVHLVAGGRRRRFSGRVQTLFPQPPFVLETTPYSVGAERGRFSSVIGVTHQ